MIKLHLLYVGLFLLFNVELHISRRTLILRKKLNWKKFWREWEFSACPCYSSANVDRYCTIKWQGIFIDVLIFPLLYAFLCRLRSGNRLARSKVQSTLLNVNTDKVNTPPFSNTSAGHKVNLNRMWTPENWNHRII